MFSLIGFVCIGSNFLQLISGLNLTSANVFMPTTGFTFICTVQGTITTEISVSDPLGNIAAACFQPPNGCGSSVSNTFNRNIADGTFTVGIVQSNVHTTNSKGNWTCTDGINVAWFDVKEIVSFTNPEISLTEAANGKMVMVLFECIYPYPEIKISYVKKSTLDHVSDTENGGIISNGTSVNCPVADARAISVNGTFPLSTRQFKEDVVVAVTIILNGIKLPIIYSNITIPSTIDCSQDIFFYGFLPVFLIVLIASIAINILKIDFLSKQFGEFTWKKVGITAVFCVIAIIIGVCLGLLIKGCDKKFLALGLSFLFGILLVVALIIVLIYYHKKCESKSDIQDGDGGEDSCNRSSQNNTGSNTTRTATGRVGSPASTSNVELAANLKSES